MHKVRALAVYALSTVYIALPALAQAAGQICPNPGTTVQYVNDTFSNYATASGWSSTFRGAQAGNADACLVERRIAGAPQPEAALPMIGGFYGAGLSAMTPQTRALIVAFINGETNRASFTIQGFTRTTIVSQSSAYTMFDIVLERTGKREVVIGSEPIIVDVFTKTEAGKGRNYYRAVSESLYSAKYRVLLGSKMISGPAPQSFSWHATSISPGT